MTERERARRALLAAALSHVPFDGWTARAIAAGAEDLGMAPGEARRLFPGGAIELLAFFMAEADRRMVEALAERDLEAMRVRERIAQAVRTRLEQNRPHREAVRRALAVLALPQNAGLALASLYRTVDAMWRAAGDRATDFNFYTKRMLLAGVYATTLLYWLEDRSSESRATWRFLERRIEDVMRIQKLRARLGRWTPDPDRVVAALCGRLGAGRAPRPPGAGTAGDAAGARG